MKKLLACVLVLGMVSSASAVGVYMAPGGTSNYSYGQSVAVAADGTAYLSGQAWVDTAYRGGYWTYSNGTLSGFNPTPANAGLTYSSNAHGIGVLGDGSLLVSQRQPADGNATWTNLPSMAANNNGHYTHFLSPGNQATVQRDAGVIRVAANGTSFYVTGKSSDNTLVGHWLVDTVTNTQSAFDGYGGMSGTTSVNGISRDGVAAGTTKPGGVNKAWVHEAGGTTILPTPAGGTGRTEAYEISADGNVVVGAAMYGTILYQAYWKKSGSTWVAEWMEDSPGQTSTTAGMAVNEDGSLIGGYMYGNPDNTGAKYHATVWHTNDLNGFNQPKVQFLTDYLADNGVTDFGGIARFDRITSISTVNGVTYIGGIAYDSANFQRGFLAVVPEPASALFLALGGLAVLRRRSR